MADYQAKKIPIFPDVNDVPIAPTRAISWHFIPVVNCFFKSHQFELTKGSKRAENMSDNSRGFSHKKIIEIT